MATEHPTPTPPSVDSEYDIVFAGGGAAACLTAGRLATADPSLKILVLEAGPHTNGLPEHYMAGRYFPHLLPTSTTMSFNFATPSEHLGGRTLIVPSGRSVGGGSSVNFMMYTRAAKSDYDDWKNIYENPGWGSDDLIPLLKKTETYQVKPDQPTHGYSGPLKVSEGGALTNVGLDFLDMVKEWDKERGLTDDANDLTTVDKYAKWLKWIDGETGRRSDVPHHFIYNQAENKNLYVAAGCRVNRIIIKDGRAEGVEFVNDIRVYPDSDQSPRTVSAKKLVVIAAGAFGSPTILERSGIGAKEILKEAGVDEIIDLPGVGSVYQDHSLAIVPYLAVDKAETYDLIFSGYIPEYTKHISQWMTDGTGFMAANGIDAGIKLRPNAEDLKEIGPDFESRWKEYFANAPDKPVLWMGCLAAYLGDHTVLPVRKYFSIGYFLTYPKSTGKLHIKSAGVYDPPEFDGGFLSDPSDLALLKWGYKKGREYARRHPLYEGDFVENHPTFPEGSKATPIADITPVELSAASLTYTAEDDKAIDEYHRQNIATTWHSLGTCPMKPRDKGGVVDPRLNVYGIKNLKVADISIAPANVGANTYSTALVIGEKAAAIIAEELGIKGLLISNLGSHHSYSELKLH